MSKTRAIAPYILFGLLAGCVANIHAQRADIGAAASYPSKTLRIIVPFGPSGCNDLLARLVGQRLTEAWGHESSLVKRKTWARSSS